MSRDEILRLPATLILTVMGFAVGLFMTYLYSPLTEGIEHNRDKIDDLKEEVSQVEREIVKLQSELKHLRRNQ